MDSKTAILGQLVHISWLFLLFSDKMAAILDLAIKYLTYSCFVVFVLILELINLYLDTKTTILCQLVIISWLSFSFPMNWRPSWICLVGSPIWDSNHIFGNICLPWHKIHRYSHNKYQNIIIIDEIKAKTIISSSMSRKT